MAKVNVAIALLRRNNMFKVDNVFGKQTVLESKDAVLQAINVCKTLKDTNKLRLAVVKLRDPEALSVWQKKHRSLKKCPTCGQCLGLN
jgi:hypothetical protein